MILDIITFKKAKRAIKAGSMKLRKKKKNISIEQRWHLDAESPTSVISVPDDKISVAVRTLTRKLGVMRSQEGFDAELVNVPELMNKPWERTVSRKVGEPILFKLKKKTKVKSGY